MLETPRARRVAYLVAVLAPAVSLLVRWPLRPVLGDTVPHMTFFPAVMIAAYLGGFWPGSLATLLSAIAANAFLIKQIPSFQAADKNNVAALILFVLVGTIISGLCESLHRARHRLLAEERRRTEEELHEAKERFRQMAENIHEIFWMMDARDDRIIYISPGYEEVSGRSSQALYERPRSWTEVIHPDDRDRMLNVVEQYRRGVFPEAEFRLLRSDSSVRWMRTRGFPLNDSAGKLSCFAGLAEDITDRKRVEEALRESELRFRAFVDHATDAFFLQDERYAILDVNRQACESLGYTRDELLGMTPMIFDPDVSLADLEEIDRRLNAGEIMAFESRHRRKDGTVFPVEVRGQAFWEGGRRLTVALVRDIAERRRAEEALRESEARFRGTFENAAIGIAHTNAAGSFLRLNQKFCSIVGYPREELLQKTFQDITYPDDLAASMELFTGLMRGESPAFGLEKRYLRKDGAPLWVQLFVSLQRDAAGRPAYAIATIQDITERKRLEAELRESEHRWRSLTEALPQLVWTATADGSCDYFSTQWTEHTGIPQSELLGWNWLETLHPDDREPTRQAWLAAVQGPGRYDVEYRVRRADGAYRWFKTRGVPIRDSAGTIVNWFGTCTDFTTGKQLEEALRQAKEAAEAANRAKDEFLANVSHEIRTPMNAILGMTELALDTPLTDDQRQCLKTVKSAADNLLGIINDLLDFSKIEAGKLELDVAGFSLRAAVGDTLRALAVRAHRKGLELVCQVQPDVPDALVGDAGRLRQVLLNLVGNAIKFTDEGEVVVEVKSEIRNPKPETNLKSKELSSSQASDEVVSNLENSALGFVSDFGFRTSDLGSEVALQFTVRDTGIGISQDRQETIFRAFEQEDTSTTRKYGGTGLGLTIAARLVDLMGGQITVESAPGQGSTFAFTARFGRQPHQPEQVHVPPPVLLHNLPVLVVDDNATNRRLLQEWLRGWQMKPVAVGDGLAALDALWHGAACGRPYAIVLLDARMPDTDGLALAIQIRQRAELSATRIIVLTSGDRPGDVARFREQRVNAHLLKPLQQDELLATIYQVMSRPNGDAPPAAQGTRAREAVPAPLPDQAPLHILVAEDNEFNALLLEQLLVRRGHHVRLANNGREALSQAQGEAFDLLLLDVHMPELDGFQVIQAIRERERSAGGHLPVIALTARSRIEDRERCLAAGMDDFLAKPIQAADLWAAIDRVVGGRPPADQPASSLLDPRVLLAACGGDAVILERICQGFRAGLPEHLTAVQDALRARDARRLREAAHKLCGMVAVFSTVAGRVASDLEDHAARGQLEEAPALVGRLETMVQEVLHQAGGLSLETLRQLAEAADDSPRTGSMHQTSRAP
jgi:two-component system sensor histidine kinase/response regulator